MYSALLLILWKCNIYSIICIGMLTLIIYSYRLTHGLEASHGTYKDWIEVHGQNQSHIARRYWFGTVLFSVV